MRTTPALTLVLLLPPAAYAQVDCSVVSCQSTDAPVVNGNALFSQDNFAPVVDGFGHVRQFAVHIPAQYDTAAQNGELIPVVFAFHGGNQHIGAMIDGKWEDYFHQEVAFVFPEAGADPCMNNQGTRWMQPIVRQRTTPAHPDCDPATLVTDASGADMTYWNTSLTGTFSDVAFVEDLRAMLLDRFPQLNPNKVYATGFSSGAGMVYTLACYRSSLFRGFSTVAEVMSDAPARGIYDAGGVTDPDSLYATCGRSSLYPGHATGILPDVWGAVQVGTPQAPFFIERRAPFALFIGDQDNDPADFASTVALIRDRNNLSTARGTADPFLDTAIDDATTERRTYADPLDPSRQSAPLRAFYVNGVAGSSGGHAIPDASECPGPATGDFMTCDYDYTLQTLQFLSQHADLDTTP